MNKRLKEGLILLSVLVGFYASGQSQEFSKNALKYGIGVGVFDGYRTTGGGGILIVGYQRDIWKDRLRLNPNLTVGYFTAKNIQDVRDQSFNSINLETILFFDLVRFKAFSLTIGAGGVINNTRGLLGTGGYPPSETSSEYISNWYYGGYFGGGIRINPTKSRLAFEIMPFNFHVGPDYYMEGYASVGIAVKLR